MPNYLKNTWYVAAEPAEIEQGEICARRILNEHVALFRTDSGDVVALEDRCSHRFAALSAGKICGELLQCPYHGARFNKNGDCVEVGGVTTIPRASKIRSYPVVEKFGYIWIWMGDPALSDDQRSIPDWCFTADHPDWDSRYSLIESYPGYYELVNDNLLDLTHLEYVHPETIGHKMMTQSWRAAGRRESGDDGSGMVENVKERGIEMKIWAKNDSSGPAMRQWIALSQGKETYEGNVDFELNVKYAAPSSFLFAGDVKPANVPEARVFKVRQLNLITPESDTSCHYFFNNATDYAPDRPEFADAIHAGFVFAFEQDRAVIAAQAQRVPDHGHNFTSMTRVCFAGDGLQNQGRQMIAKMVDEEREVMRI